MLDAPHEVDFGQIRLRPRERSIVGASGQVSVEPLVVRLLLALSRRAGLMVDRAALFRLCWGDTPVGDDSLNRIVASLRKALRAAGAAAVEIETIPAAGYVLRLSLDGFAPAELAAAEVAAAKRAGFDSWRAGVPEPDCLVIERLRRAVALAPDDADAWGMLALMLRHAAEYAPEGDRRAYVADCENAAERALVIDPTQPEAQVAKISIAPLFGHWEFAHDRLSALRAAHPDNIVVAHDLAIVEMSTGRVRAAKSLIDPLIANDQIAAIFGYKSTYHHWSIGDLDTMDRRADSAIQLWPTHPAIWTSRFWTLAYTKREAAAMRMLDGEAIRPRMTETAVHFLRDLLDITQRGGARDLDRIARRAIESAANGPAAAINSLFALGLISDAAGAKVVLDAYYLHDGRVAVPNNAFAEAPVNEMRRRVTQILFTPACAAVRSSAWFETLCDRTGLTGYWTSTRRHPDFRH